MVKDKNIEKADMSGSAAAWSEEKDCGNFDKMAPGEKDRGNYDKMAQGARDLFLKKDQEAMIRLWDLEHDDDFLYVRYFSQDLMISRKTGRIESKEQGGYPLPSQVEETMVLFDFLCHPKERPHSSGEWASISSLGGIIGSYHQESLTNNRTRSIYEGKTEELKKAAGILNGIPFPIGDASFRIPVFEDFQILFQFWDGDDEFPPNIQYLFDKNALQYMHYETLWYVMNSLTDRIRYYGNI